jgi:hypothetical protein
VFSGYTPIGLFTQQRTTYSGEGNNRDDIYYFYMTYVNATLQRHVLGTRTNDHGQSTSSMIKLFYTDGSPNAVSANLRETFFETAPDGRVLTAWRTQWARLPSLIFPMQFETGVTRFLYEVNAGAAHVLGSYSSSMVSTPYGSNGLRWLLQDGSTRSAFMLAGGFRPQHPIQMVSST